MPISEEAIQYFKELFHERKSRFHTLDPELGEIYVNFAYGEVITSSTRIDTHTRLMLHLAALVSSGGEEMYKVMLEGALNVGVSAVEIKEILYQAVAYVGMGRIYDFLRITNNELMRRDEKLPLPAQSTTTRDTRMEEGDKILRTIFGDEAIDATATNTPDDQQVMLNFLRGNCFGDIYTRSGIDIKTRELLTLVMLVSMGGCEAQLRGHINGNLNVGNDRALLIETIIQLLPLIGYPRTLNGLRVVTENTNS